MPDHGLCPRRLPAAIGGDLGGVYTVRTLADVDAMRAEFAPESAPSSSAAAISGLRPPPWPASSASTPTVLEMAPRILQRVASPETSQHVRALHRAHGVTILEETGLDRLVGDSRVTAARLKDGRDLPADFVIVGVGITPNDALAATRA